MSLKRKLLLLVVLVVLTAVLALGAAPGPVSTAGAVGSASTNVTLHQILEAWRYALLHRSLPSAEGGLMTFGNSGYTDYGEWYTDVNYSPTAWRPGTVVTLNARLVVSDLYLEGVAARKIIADGLCLLVTAERTFDADGRFRQVNDERMSTLITPTGLPIEGGVQGAATTRFGYYGFRTPVDELQIVSLAGARRLAGQREVRFSLKFQLPPDLPPGIYRLRLDYGVVTKEKRYYNLNCDSFARRSFPRGRVTESHIYSPLIRASGTHVSGRAVDAAAIRPRLPWVLLNAYNSNGYRGVVAEEDKAHFGISGRNLIQDDVILPLYSNPADTRNRLTYNLEPQFPTDTIELRTNLPWNFE
ncbi:MAG: hypothetical protein FJW34_24060, partial [Acidobacteria bacterium]|nr:hypothetical protein [Acidobacteriota bacterium]